MIREQVLHIIATAIGVERSMLTDDTSIGDLPEWDSVGNLAIIAAIEEQLDIEIPLDDLFEMNSVSNIVDEVIKLKNVG